MTTLYFVRHAQPNYDNHNDLTRELTEKGLSDRKKILKFFCGKDIDYIFSSHFKRCIDTISPLAKERNKDIIIREDLRERCVGNIWLSDFDSFAQKQWEDFSYALEGGENLAAVQHRNISVIKDILKTYPDKNIVIATHGTALSTIINYYDKSWNYPDFKRIKSVMPFIAVMKFDGEKFINRTMYEEL